jgi:hypothetical protein
MTKIAKTAATVIALTLAAHASSAYAGTLTNAPKTATVTPSVPKIPTVIPSAPKATLPTIIPTVSNVASNIPASTGFGTGVWQSQSVTTRNPVTGLQASSLSRLTFSPNGTFTDNTIVEGGTEVGPGQYGAGGLVEITGKYKVISPNSIQFTATSESICTGLGCMSYPISNQPTTTQITPVSPGVVTGSGGATWKEVQ